VRFSLCLGALATSWLGASSAAAQRPAEQVQPCPLHWNYRPPSGYLAPPIVGDSAGDFFWREGWTNDELVAVREGVTRWRRPLRPTTDFPFNAMVLHDVLVQAVGSRVEARRVSDGRTAWTRDLRADHTPLQISTIARLGRAIVVAAAASATDGWLIAIRSDGRTLWRTRVPGAVARMAANGSQLSLLMSETRSGETPINAVDSTGKPIAEALLPQIAGRAVRGDEVVFDRDHAVTATIGPLPQHCPPQSPSCRPPPDVLTVTGLSPDGMIERWHFGGPPAGLRVQLLLLSDSAALLVDSAGVHKISSEGTVAQVCSLPVAGHWSAVGLVRGDLVIADRESVAGYTLPGAPRLAATGWVMRGGGPAQDWSAR
jgi:hypothetical protein